jgi:hypothetical protein
MRVLRLIVAALLGAVVVLAPLRGEVRWPAAGSG